MRSPLILRKSLLAIIFVNTLIFMNLIASSNSSILEKIRDDSDLSQFYALLERNPIANSSLQYRSVTLFVPTNQAFQSYHENASVLYHLTTVALGINDLKGKIPSDLDGNPPLYITRRNGEVYVNNAKIIPSRSVQMRNSQDKKQWLHVIDEVLQPLTILPTSKLEIINPNALIFLLHSDSLNLGDYRLRSYRSQVTLMRKENWYQSPGLHTFLIPIDEGFKKTTRSSLVDGKVIDGHVIPNNVIFTSSAPMEVPQTTAAFEDNIKVTVSFFKQKDNKVYVKSNTIIGDSKHSTGVVLAEIVKGNIPVSNGVVHLIHRPLMIVDTTVTQFLQHNENGALHKFYEVIMDIGGEVLDDINHLGEVTILAPSNEAWNDSLVNNIIRDKAKMRDILNMHIIKGRWNIETIRQKNMNSITHVPTVNNKTFLYFNVIGNNNTQTISVEGGGVNATLLQADVAQTNGYVHIIDRVLGVPYTTVMEKLSTDPMMNSTYYLGEITGFNKQLNQTGRRYTYFVPRDWAWKDTGLRYPSVHKKLFMKDFSYHARAILERHLVIADRTYTMQDLASMSTDSIVLPTFRDSLKVRVIAESGRYSIIWNLRKIPVFRPDVECTNGIIHVLDQPFLEESDIIVNGGILQAQLTLSVLFSNLFMIFIIKLLL